MAESSAATFRWLAERRVSRTIKNIRLISNISNWSNYSYTQGQVDRLFRALDRELKMARARFDGELAGEHSQFTLAED